MAAEPKTRVIDGLACTSTPLPVMRALNIITECTGLMEAMDAGSDVAMFGAVAKELGGKLDDLLPRILAGTKIKTPEGDVTLNTGAMIDHAFDGRMGALPAVFAFACEVSFRDFFGGLVRLIAQLKIQVAAFKGPAAAPAPASK